MGLEAGTRLRDNLVLERKLGAGAMGTLWLAHNEALGSQVAIKVLHQGASSPEARARFEQEARGAASIVSPHVVTIFDFGITEDDEPFIVMELLRGRDLRECIETEGPLSLGDTVEVVDQMCRALGRAHARGIIHRDVKPANVFMVDNDDALLVKVLDFGVAKHSGEEALGMTETGAMMGTPYYMSPEQLMDPRSVDEQTDVWAVGAVAYACLTASVPFGGETLGALSVAIHTGDFTPPCVQIPALPAAVDGWMARALARDKAQRFASVREMASALRALVQSEAPASTASEAPERAQRAVVAVSAQPGDSASEALALDGAPTLGMSPLGLSPLGMSPLGLSPLGLSPLGMSHDESTNGPADVEAHPPTTPGDFNKRNLVLAALGGALLLGGGAWLGSQLSNTNSAAAGLADASASVSATATAMASSITGDPDHVPSASSASAPTTAADGSSSTSPAPTASASTTVVAATPPKPVAPAAPRRPRWRKLRMKCHKNDTSKSCSACCPAQSDGDKVMLQPYPSCECMFDGWSWDKRHGRAP